MSNVIKNISNISKTWAGLLLEAGASYTIHNQIESERYLGDDAFISDLVAGNAEVNSNILASDSIRDLSSPNVNVVSSPLQEPFASPSYRTKRKGADTFVTIIAGATQTIDFPLANELYCHGGILVYENALVGDTITAEIIDSNGVIPLPYRSLVCEAYPIVANYIENEPIPPGSGSREINTYPLNAKITAGLVLRVIYSACNRGVAREVGIGYYLTRKL